MNLVIRTAKTEEAQKLLEIYSYYAQFFGSNVKKYYDIGIAGLHRLLDKIDEIKQANVIIAVADTTRKRILNF